MKVVKKAKKISNSGFASGEGDSRKDLFLERFESHVIFYLFFLENYFVEK